MRQQFYFALSIFFWIVMAIGFSDNWLTDRGQESNSDWRFMVHAFFAFSWFTLLVIQTGLIQRGSRKLHMKTGIAGMVVFAGFLITTVPHYVDQYSTTGKLAPLSTMIFAQLILATILIVMGFAKRKTDSRTHKTNMMVGTFMLLQPAADSAIGHLFGRPDVEWLLLYTILFGLFIWRHKGIRWQITVAFVTWFGGLLYYVNSMMGPASG